MTEDLYLKRVVYIGDTSQIDGPKWGDVGYVIDVSSHDTFMVEFMNTDGSTKSITVLKREELRLLLLEEEWAHFSIIRH